MSYSEYKDKWLLENQTMTMNVCGQTFFSYSSKQIIYL